MTVQLSDIKAIEAQLTSTGDDNASASLLESFSAEQPPIHKWVMYLYSTLGEETGPDAVIFGLILWQAYHQRYGLPFVPKQRLERASNSFAESTGDLFESPPAAMIEYLTQQWKLREPAIAQYLVETIYGDPDDDGYAAEEKQTLLFNLVTIVGAIEEELVHKPATTSQAAPLQGWDLVQERLSSELRAAIAQFVQTHPGEPVSGFILDCNAHYGSVLPGFDTEAGFQERAARYANAGPQELDRLRWSAGDLEHSQFAEISLGSAESLPDAELESSERTALFMDAVCRVLIRLEQEGAFAAMQRSAEFSTLVADHDEPLEQSRQRLAQVRTHGASARHAPSAMTADTAALEANLAGETETEEERESRALGRVAKLAMDDQADQILPYLKSTFPDDADDIDRLDNYLDRVTDYLGEAGNRPAARRVFALRYELNDEDDDQAEWLDDQMSFLFD